MKGTFFDNKKYLSSKEVSEILGYTQEQISKLARSGEIQGRKIKNRWYFEESQFVSSNKSKNKKTSTKSQYVIGIIIVVISLLSFYIFVPKIIINHLTSDIPKVSTEDKVNNDVLDDVAHEIKDVFDSAVSVKNFIYETDSNLDSTIETVGMVFNNLKTNYVDGYKVVKDATQETIDKGEVVYKQTASTLGFVKDASEIVADSVYDMFSPIFVRDNCQND